MKYNLVLFALAHLVYFIGCKPNTSLRLGRENGLLESTTVDCDDPRSCARNYVFPPECKKAGKHPAAACNQYYECVNPAWWMFWSWEAKLNTCPKGQAFDVKTNDCKVAALVDCLSTPTTTASTVEAGTTVESTGVEVSKTDDEIYTTNEKSSKSTLSTVDNPTFNISTVSSTESEAISEINDANKTTITSGGKSTIDSTFNQSTFSTTDVEIFTTNERGTEISGENYSTIEDSTISNSTFEISINTDSTSTILTTIFTHNETGEISTVDSTTDSEIFTMGKMDTEVNKISSEHYSTFDMPTISTITNEGGISTVDSIFNDSIFSTTDMEFTTNITETEISSENYSTIEDSSTIYSTLDISINKETSTILTTLHEIFTRNEVESEETDSTITTKNQNQESTTVKTINTIQNANNMSKIETSTSSTVFETNNSTITKNENTKNVDSSTSIAFFDSGTSSTASTIFADSTAIDANISTAGEFSYENTTSFSVSGTTKFNNSEKHRESTEETTITDGTDSPMFVISFEKLLLFNVITYLLWIK